MKVNAVIHGNRTFIDAGDLNASLFNYSMSYSEPDKPTLATVVSGNNYIASKLAEKQPKEGVLYVISVPDKIYFEELKRVLKENVKRLPKKKGEEIVVAIDQETYTEEKKFTDQQIEQFTAMLTTMLTSQSEELKKIFADAVSKIKITAPATPSETKPKK